MPPNTAKNGRLINVAVDSEKSVVLAEIRVVVLRGQPVQPPQQQPAPERQVPPVAQRPAGFARLVQRDSAVKRSPGSAYFLSVENGTSSSMLSPRPMTVSPSIGLPSTRSSTKYSARLKPLSVTKKFVRPWRRLISNSLYSPSRGSNLMSKFATPSYPMLSRKLLIFRQNPRCSRG